MVAAGMNIMRLNLSHGGHDEQWARVDTLRDIVATEGARRGDGLVWPDAQVAIALVSVLVRALIDRLID